MRFFTGDSRGFSTERERKDRRETRERQATLSRTKKEETMRGKNSADNRGSEGFHFFILSSL